MSISNVRIKQIAVAASIAAVIVLSACAAPPAQVRTIDVTRVVEVTKVVEGAAAPAATAAPAAAPALAVSGETLKTVQDRGTLICGVNNQVPGFGFVDPAGDYSGFDVDFCKAIAAAIFGDSSKVEYRPLNAQQRFTALQSGDIDVLIRNTTWTLQRDSELGTNFVATTFYDGQGIMVPTDSGITKLEDLADKTVCVQAGTTTELNLADVMATRNIAYKPLVFENPDQTFGAYTEDRCDAVTSDKSQLVSRRSILQNPADHTVLDVTLSKEPLGPTVRHGDDQWFDIVKWVVFATMAAEEYGVDSKNVDQIKAETTNPEIKRLLGTEGDMGPKLGLSNDWAVNVIKAVGNFGEIYDRNLGPNTPTAVPRGLNNLYTNGGLIYSPPIR